MGNSLISSTQLRMEDYADDVPDELAPVFEKLFGQLNPHMNDLSVLLNKRLTFGANIAAVFKDVTVNIPSVDWTYIGDTGAPAFSGTWVNYDNTSPYTDERAAFRINPEGLVSIKGTIKDGTINTSAFTLPPGFRPQTEINLACATNTGYGRLLIDETGVVQPVSGGTGWFAVQAHFYAEAVGGAQEWVGAVQNWRDKSWPVTVKATDTNGQDVVGDVKAVIPVMAWDLTKNVNTISSDTRTDGVNVQTGNAVHGCVWEPKGKGQVLLRRIGGLSPGRTYRVTLLIIGG